MKYILMKYDSIKFQKEASYVGTYNDIISAIELDRGEIFYQNVVKPKISEFMGSVFEQICRHYTLICGVTGKLDYFVTTVGRWWGRMD